MSRKANQRLIKLNTLKRLQAPQKQGKKKSPVVPARSRSEIELLRSYRERIIALGVHGEQLARLDLENEFYWLFRLSGLLAEAYRMFDKVNERHFASRLIRPKIIFCNRSSGGYYSRARHTIGISIAMTVEFGESEFFETLLHEIAHIVIQSHSVQFYALLTNLGGGGKKAPLTMLLAAKRARYREKHYPVIVVCPNCKHEHRYRTRRALRYACRPCCTKYAGGKYDARFKFITVTSSVTL
jgi:ribosomal protein L37AE/L43A